MFIFFKFKNKQDDSTSQMEFELQKSGIILITPLAAHFTETYVFHLADMY